MDTRARWWVAGFIAGALGVLLGHQPMLALLNAQHFVNAHAYSARPTGPLHVPQIVSTCFWSGLWGVVFAWAQRRFPRGPAYWLLAFAFGAALPTLVAWLVVPPLKGLPIRGFDIHRILVGVVVNGAWGLATALVLRAMLQGAGPARAR